jgi:hypothetical protein
MKKLRKWLLRSIKSSFNLYEISELQIGGHCGCCGHWIPNEIFPKDWSWGLCQDCINDSVEMDVVKYLKLK